MPKNVFLFVSLCFLTAFLSAQTPFKVEKWGKIPDEDLLLTHCPFDSAAAAMMLQEVGHAEVTFDREGTVVVYNYWARIKIFDASALEEGNLLIPYYSDRDLEQFLNLDVQLILPDGERQKVQSDNVFTTKVNKNVSVKKVFIPNLQKGCIIEYRYEIKSFDYISMYGTWYFQQEIPVRWSQLKVTIPQYFNYVYLMKAPRAFDLQKSEQNTIIGLNGKRYDVVEAVYGLGNLPAIKDEPYITTLDDYRAHIGFQLNDINIPGRYSEKYLTSWSDVANKMEKHEQFGLQYNKSGNFDKLWAAFRVEVPESTPKSEIPEKVLRFVTRNIKWNGANRRFSANGLDAAFTQKTGSTADLNLAVVALLRKSGFDAVPMLISTRDHGATYSVYPFADQFNSVVAFLYEGEGGILIDATHPCHPLGEMRDACYNEEGWLVDEKRPNWVQITAPEYSTTWYGKMKMTENGEMSGHVSMSLGGAAATSWREELQGENEAEFVKKNFATDFPERRIDSVVIRERDTYQQPLKLDFFCSIPNAATVINDFIYLRPVLDFIITENPLKNPKRSFPVSFTYPMKAQYVLQLDLPEGYTLEDEPTPVRINLPNEGGKVQFTCGKMTESQIQIVLKLTLTQLTFQPEDYLALRQFFELVAEKVQLQLALKKK